MRLRTLLLPFVALALLAPAAPALAAVSVSIDAVPSKVAYGTSVSVTGAITPAGAETVELLEQGASGPALDNATTDATTGAYSLSFVPQRTTTVFVRSTAADTTTAESEARTVEVMPTVTVSLQEVRLFDLAEISGTIEPAALSGQATVRLVNADGVTLNKRTIAVSGGSYATTLRVTKPGVQRAIVTVTAAGFATGEGTSAWKTPPLPNLRTGSRGIFVLLLERRLRELNYKSPLPDRRFTYKTADAVLAFRKVQRQRRTRSVGPATWRALASPKIPKARFAKPAFHIEVDQSRQVLYLVRGGVVRKILHVSTGGPGIGTTRNGTFRVWLKFPGYSPKGLYMPAFFDGQRGIHGWPEVPPVPASHGCVRVPMWTARWMYSKVRVGTVVRIYGVRR